MVQSTHTFSNKTSQTKKRKEGHHKPPVMPSINFPSYPAVNQTIYSPTKNSPKTPTSISSAIFTIGFAPSPAVGTLVVAAAAVPLAVPLAPEVEPVEVVEVLEFIAKAWNASKVLLPFVALATPNALALPPPLSLPVRGRRGHTR
jgi:hypothetical protein